MARRMTGGEAMVEAALAHGVDTVFALPGVQTYPLMDALARKGNAVRVVSPRHEQTTAYMATGYAKATGRPGVCSVVPGPGVLNAGAALLQAASINAPVMALTGDVPSPFLGKGRGHLHELPDQLATLRTFVKWAGRAGRTADAPAVVDEAWRQMASGRPGPVAVEMAWDTMAQSGEVEIGEPAPLPGPPAPDPEAVAAAAALIAEAKRPMITLGNGATHAGAEVLALAEALGAPVTAHRGGRGIVAADHPLCASTVGAYEMWAETDLLIGIGTRCEMQAMRWTGMMDASDRLPGGRKLIRIDIEAEEMLRLIPDAGIVADAAAGTAALTAALVDRDPDPEAAARVAAAEASARAQIESVQPHMSYVDEIRAALPRDGILVKDICQTGFTTYFGYPVYETRTYLNSGYQGNLGHALPMALGAKVGRPDVPVVVATGDGGFMFAAAELSTAAQHGIAVIVIVFNNRVYGNVRRDQERLYEGRVLGSDLPGVDYVALAEAQGVKGARVSSPAALRPVLKRAIAQHKPMLIEVEIDPKIEVPPWPFIIRQG